MLESCREFSLAGLEIRILVWACLFLLLHPDSLTSIQHTGYLNCHFFLWQNAAVVTLLLLSCKMFYSV